MDHAAVNCYLMQTAEPADSDQSFWDVLQGRRQKRFEESEMFQRLGKYELEKRIPVLEIVAIKKKSKYQLLHSALLSTLISTQLHF